MQVWVKGTTEPGAKLRDPRNSKVNQYGELVHSYKQAKDGDVLGVA